MLFLVGPSHPWITGVGGVVAMDSAVAQLLLESAILKDDHAAGSGVRYLIYRGLNSYQCYFGRYLV